MRLEGFGPHFGKVLGVDFPDWQNVPRPHGDISRLGILKMDSPLGNWPEPRDQILKMGSPLGNWPEPRGPGLGPRGP